MASIEEGLCTSCGLCCDGSLFAEVELAGRRESSGLEAIGLAVDDSDDEDETPVLNHPCAALKDKRCSIYEFRPNCCRTFECGLLQRVKGGGITMENAQSQVRVVQGMIQQIETWLARLGRTDPTLPLKERWQEAISASADPTPGLLKAIAEVDRLIHETFLSESRRKTIPEAGRDRGVRCAGPG